MARAIDQSELNLVEFPLTKALRNITAERAETKIESHSSFLRTAYKTWTSMPSKIMPGFVEHDPKRLLKELKIMIWRVQSSRCQHAPKSQH